MVRPCHLNPMKPFILLLIVAGLPSAAMAGSLGKKERRGYSHLWSNSPFTETREVVAPPPANPFEHLALAGVAPIPGGYRINLLDRRNPATPILLSERPELRVISVDYSAGNLLQTTVRLSQGGTEGVVTFDPKLLMPRPNAANAPASPIPQPAAPIPARQPRGRTTEAPSAGANRPH